MLLSEFPDPNNQPGQMTIGVWASQRQVTSNPWMLAGLNFWTEMTISADARWAWLEAPRCQMSRNSVNGWIISQFLILSSQCFANTCQWLNNYMPSLYSPFLLLLPKVLCPGLSALLPLISEPTSISTQSIWFSVIGVFPPPKKPSYF